MTLDYRSSPQESIERWSKRHLIAVVHLAATTVPLLLTAQSVRSNGTQQEKWKEYTFPDDGFAITLPERVDPHEDSTLSPATFKAFTVSTTYIYTVRLASGLVLGLHVVTFPGGCSDFLNKLQAAMADPGKMGIHVDPSESDKVTEVGGYPAVEGERDTEPKFRSYDRFQCVDKKLYVFSTSWPRGSKMPPEIRRAIDSFRILKK
jgi:hypothetical protein